MKILCLVTLIAAMEIFGQESPRSIQVPGETAEQTVRWLEQRKARQIEAAKGWELFHGFRFHDGLEKSGITFKHKVVDEAGKRFKPNHYDHGSGLAAADVDADGLIDLFFVNQRGGNELWRNRGEGRFENITARAGLALKDKICVAASFGDVDNDGQADLFVTTVNMGNHLFKNEGGGRFRDITESAGIKEKEHSSGAVFFDYNRDGLLDLFVCNVGVFTMPRKAADGSFHAYEDAFTGFLQPARFETSVLYRNLGGSKFAVANRETGLEHREWSGDATFCDLNGTGYPALYVVSMSGTNAFYQNSSGKSFRNEMRPVFRRTPWGAMGVKFFDYNQDGLFDLYVTDMHSDMNTVQLQIGATNRTEQFAGTKSEAWCSAEWVKNQWPGSSTNFVFGNALYQNSPSGFSEVSDRVGAETYWPWGVSVGDLNADGFEDVFVTAGMGYPLHYGINSLLLNEAGKKFRHGEFVVGVEPRPGNKVLIDYFTVDCSGEDKGHPFCQGKPGKVVVRGSTSSRSSVICDWDEDGDLDLAVNNMSDVPLMLLNDLAEKRPNRFLKVRLHGTVSNRDGLGATVKVVTAEHTWTQFHDGKSGYLSQSSLPLYFGLSAASKVERVEVLWPAGGRQILTNDLALNRTIEVVEKR